MSNASTINIDIKVNDSGAITTVKKLGSELNTTGATGTKSFNSLTTAAHSTSQKMKDMVATIGVYTLAFGGASAVTYGLANEFKKGLSAVEDFNLGVAQSAAFIVTFSEQAQKGDFVGAFAQANEYAGYLNQKLEQLDAMTIATGKDLQVMSQTMLQHGVILDVNNQKEVEGFTNIATALALVTAGQNKDIQLRQEINALLDGQIRATDRLPKLLEAIDPQLKEHLVLWKSEGTLIENVGALLKGFGADIGNLDALWATVGSTMQTIHDRILRGAFEPIFKDLIGLAKDFNRSMMDTNGQLTPMAKTLQKDFRDAYETGKDLVKEYGGELVSLAGYLLAAKVAQLAFNAAANANPYVMAATALIVLNEQMSKVDVGFGEMDLSLTSLDNKYFAFTGTVGRLVDVMRGLRDPETGRALTEQEQILNEIASLQAKLKSQSEGWHFFPKTEAWQAREIKAEIKGLEQSLKDLSYAETDLARERARGGGEYQAMVIKMAKANIEIAEQEEALLERSLAAVEKRVEKSDAAAVRKADKEIAEAERAAEKLEDLNDELDQSMAQHDADRVAMTLWSDGIIHETVQSQLDYKLKALEIEVAEMREVAALDQETQQKITAYHADAIEKIQSYDEQYSGDNKARIESMEDSWMHLEKIRTESTDEAAQKIIDFEEEIESYRKDATQRSMDRLDTELQVKLQMAGEDKAAQQAVLEWYKQKNREIVENAWQTARDNLLASGSYVDGVKAGLIEVQNDFTTMGDVSYGVFMDIRDTFRSEVGDYLIKKFGGIEGAWGGLWDKALVRFGDYLGDMVFKFAAAVTEMVAIWAATELGKWWTGNSSFTLGSSSPAAGGSSGGSTAGNVAGGVASSVALGLIKDAIMTNIVTPAWTAISGGATTTGAGAAVGTGTTTGSISASTGIIGTSSAAGTSGGAAAAHGAEFAVDAGSSGASAGMGAASITTGFIALGLALHMLDDYTVAGDLSRTGKKRTPGTFEDVGLRGDFTAVETDPRIAAALESLGHYEMQMEHVTAASINAADGVLMFTDVITGDHGLNDTMGYSMYVFDEASQRWSNQTGLFIQMTNEMDRMNPTTEANIKSTAEYIATAAGFPSLADELIFAFKTTSTEALDLSTATLDATDGIMLTANAAKGLSGQMGFTMQIFDQASGKWVDQSDLFRSMVAEMERIGPVTEDNIQSTADYVAAAMGVPLVADELADAFIGMKYGIYSLAGASANAAATIHAAAAGVNSANAAVRQQSEQALADLGYDREDIQNFVPGEEWEVPQEYSHAKGGLIDRVIIPDGDRGLISAQLGEGVIDADTMQILSRSIKNGTFGNSDEMKQYFVAMVKGIKEVRKSVDELIRVQMA